MKNNIPGIKVVDVQTVDIKKFKVSYTSCIILTAQNKILLQQRGKDWDRYPGLLATFGGKIEMNETPVQALIRELQEELNAYVNEAELVTLGAVTEKITNHQELIYQYFWHDVHHTISACNEGVPKYFDSVAEVNMQPNLMDDARWAIVECCKRNLLKQ